MTYISNNIDLRYIDAREVESFLRSDVADYIEFKLESELSRINGYIEKYDNQWDKMEGTSVNDLKDAKDQVQARLEAIRQAFKPSDTPS